MSDCIFCKVVAGDIPSKKIYEDENYLAFLDINPVNPGHTLVIPKNHYEDLLEMPEIDAANIAQIVKILAPAITRAVGSEGFNLGLNNGAIAGQVVPHVHFHIMPRFEGDGHRLFEGKPYEDGEDEMILDKIKNEL